MPPNAPAADQGEDLYSSAPAQKPSMAPDDEKVEHEDDQATGLLPKDLFQGKDLKPGTRYEVEIGRVMDKEVEVRIMAGSDAEEKGEEEQPPAGGPPADDESAPAPASMFN